jgi:D-proline reductase (dithiol) PrdB
MTVSDEPIRYMERTRQYYRALGYYNDYAWAHFADVPFTRLGQPLSQSRIALITTASPLGLANRDARGIRHVWSGPVEPPPEALFTDNVAWDKNSTHTKDRGSYLPIEVASELAAEGLIAGIAARFHGVPTEYSQRKTRQEDAPEVLARVRADGADAALLCAL